MSCQTHDADHAALLRLARLRVTAARIAILDVLCHAERALDAQQVFDQLRSARTPAGKPIKTDRVTIYRTLTALAKSKIAHRVDVGDRIHRYALAGEHTAHDHDRSHVPHDHDSHASPSAIPAHAPGARHADAAHPHFVCDSCGRVECVDDLTVVLKPTRRGSSAARTRRELRITREEVLLHGTCKRCAKSAD